MTHRAKVFLLGLLLAVYALVALGCHGYHHPQKHGPKVDGSGKLVAEQRTVGTFHGVRLEGVGKVFLKQEDEQKVRVEADDNILRDVVTEVSGGILRVRMSDDRNYGDIKVTVHISAKTIDEASISGAGEIKSENDLECDDLKCSLSGVGSISLSGKCRELDVALSGVGNISNEGLVSERCTARVSGMGNCEVNVTKELDASVSGMGKITYAGDPSEVHRNVSGMGTVERK